MPALLHDLDLDMPIASPCAAQQFSQFIGISPCQIDQQMRVEQPFRSGTLDLTRTPDPHLRYANGKLLKYILQARNVDGKRLGRPPMMPIKIGRIRAALSEGKGVRETARLLKVSAAKVSEIERGMNQSNQAVAA